MQTLPTPPAVYFELLAELQSPQASAASLAEKISLDAHRETPHYKKFRDATDHMVAERSIQRCSVLSG